MTTMIAELYDALLAAGSPEDKARKAAEAMAGYEAYEGRFVRIESDLHELKGTASSIDRRLSALEGEVRLLKWMIGFVLAFLVAISIKLFVH
jgi:uncharacterized membrane protein affecting hemolysin expression